MAQFTIELPDQVARELEAYLQANPQESLVGLIHEVLQIKLTPKDPSQLLALAGIVADAPRGAAEHAEDFAENQLLKLDPEVRLKIVQLLAQGSSSAQSSPQGAESSLVDFFRNSPLCDVAEEIDLSRDCRFADERIIL